MRIRTPAVNFTIFENEKSPQCIKASPNESSIVRLVNF